MKVAIVGAGGTGGFFGGCLARAGADVAFLARGAHLEAMTKRGLRVESATQGDFTVPVRATADARDIGPVDLVLFCVKTYSLNAAIEAARPLVGRATALLPVLNGVEAADRLGRTFGAPNALGGVAYLESSVVAPGHVRHASVAFDHLLFGELSGGRSGRCDAIEELLARAGFHVEQERRIQIAMWTKFAFICGLGGVSAATQVGFGTIRTTPETRALVEAAMTEVGMLASAQDVDVPSDLVARQMAKVGALAPDGRTSMAKDRSEGKQLELDALNGAVVRLANQRSVPVPVNAALHALLKPHEQGRQEG